MLLAACSSGPPRPPEPLESASEFESRGIEMYNAGEYAEAIHQFEKAFGQYSRLDRREPMQRNRIYTAQSALLINDLPHARTALDGLAELIDQTETPAAGAQRYRLWLLQSEYLMRIQRNKQALVLLESIIGADDAPPAILGSALINRAQLAVAAGSSDRDRWLQRAQSAAGVLNQNRLLRLKASALSDAGNNAAAEGLLMQALENYRGVLFQPGIAATLGELGGIKQAQGSPDEARFFFRRALEIRLDLEDLPSAIELASSLQAVETGSGNDAAAEAYAGQLKKLESLLTTKDSQL
ncbi:MAG TPA: tetratricopeptide repeat protein [Gammaproteobacteria bacterium]|nr:tetratricopeptide repeat protein [Gammaproteobacteria bacterium]